MRQWYAWQMVQSINASMISRTLRARILRMSVSSDDVVRLANLARIALSDEEVEKLRGEIESIVKYIDVVQQVPMPEGISGSPHLDLQNVMRDDGTPHDGGMYTDDMVKQMPNHDGNYLKVKKILG